jgi:hypothetical protein
MGLLLTEFFNDFRSLRFTFRCADVATTDAPAPELTTSRSDVTFSLAGKADIDTSSASIDGDC